MARKLYEIAHARAGDKGNASILSLIAYAEEDFELIRREVTAARVKQHLASIVHGEVTRYELPQLLAPTVGVLYTLSALAFVAAGQAAARAEED